MFMFFLLFAACFAAEQTYTIGAQAEIVIQLNKDELTEKIVNKCFNADIFRFKITKEGEQLKFNIYTETDCTEDAALTIDMTEVTKELPKIQEVVTVNTDVTVTLGFPYGCLLKYLPEITTDAKGELNYEFVHTQFGADIHMYKTEDGKNVEECKGIDTIIKMFSQASSAGENAKFIMKEANLQIEQAKEFAQGAINMFETIKKELYTYTNKLPAINVNDYIYEFNGEIMKIYQVVKESGIDVIKYVQDAIIPKAEEIIGKLKDAAGKEFSITADCDPLTGNSFGYYDGKLQMTSAKECNFNINGFNLNLELNFQSILNANNTIKINGQEFSFTELSNYAKDLKTQAVAIVESFGSNMEFEMNKCKPIGFSQMLTTFTDFTIGRLVDLPVVGDSIKGIVERVDDVSKAIDEIMKYLENFPLFTIPTYGYKIGLLKTGKEGKSFATYSFYTEETCSGNPMLEFVIGVVTDLKTEDVETGFELTRYLDKESCAAKQGKEGYYTEHVTIEKCINGYQFKYEDEQLKMVPCGNTKQATQNDDTAYKCETCVECQKKAAMKGDYAYVTCGTSSIFMLLVALMFFILF